ncbi:MAG: hypothetical protein ACTSYI_03725 [Promethearchaeota archaeon]
MANSRKNRALDEFLSPSELEIFQNKEFRKILTPNEFRHLESNSPPHTLPPKVSRDFPSQTQHISRYIADFHTQIALQWYLPSGIEMLDQFFPGSQIPPQESPSHKSPSHKLPSHKSSSHKSPSHKSPPKESSSHESYPKESTPHGLPSHSLTLFYGKARSGKSQICHQLPIELFKLSPVPPGKNIIFIDTENTFRPSRIKEIATTQKLLDESILSNIISVGTPNYASFNLTMTKIPELLSSLPIKLLIIDSLTNVYRVEIAQNPENVNSIIANLAKNLKKLTQWAITYNLVVCLTSQVTSTFDKTYFFDVIPVLSTTLNRYIKNWILLGEGDQEANLTGIHGLRYAHLVNSENAPEKIIKFEISSSGVKDFIG